MNPTDLIARAATIFADLTVVAEDGTHSLSPDFVALRDDIDTALGQPDAPDELRELAQALDMMAMAMSDPETAASVAEGAQAARESRPAIFDAIEDCDVDAVRVALSDWDVNQPVGEFEATALYHAMSSCTGASLAVMHLLLDAGADPKKGLTETNVLHGLGFANLDGIDPSALAQVIRRCVDLGADIEQRSNKLRWTPLITAASEWNPVAVEALLLAGADIDACAGQVVGVCLAGSDSMAFAAGHDATLGVLRTFKTGGKSSDPTA